MSRVAKARDKAGVTAASVTERWEPDNREDTQDGPALPWNIRQAPPAEEDFGLRVDQAPAIDQVPDSIGGHLAGLVRRVFLPPPLGAGLRSVLYCAADGGSEAMNIAFASAHVLAAETQSQVCVWNAGPDGAPGQLPAEASTGATSRMSDNLWIAVPAAPAASMRAEVAERQMTVLRERFDYVLVDAPGLIAGGEPTLLTSLVEGVILVIDEERTRRDEARYMADVLKAAGAALLGAVLANRCYPIPARIYHRL